MPRGLLAAHRAACLQMLAAASHAAAPPIWLTGADEPASRRAAGWQRRLLPLILAVCEERVRRWQTAAGMMTCLGAEAVLHD